MAGGMYPPWPHYLMQHAYQAQWYDYSIDTVALIFYIRQIFSFGCDILNLLNHVRL